MVNGFPSHFWTPSLIKIISLKLRTLFGDFVLITSLLTPLTKSFLCLSHIVTHIFASSVEVPYVNGSWTPFQATNISVLPNNSKKILHLPAQTAPSTHIMLFHLSLSMAPSYLSFSYMKWTQRGRALSRRKALPLMPKLAQGSSLMTSTAGLALLRSLLSILNFNWMSAYLKVSHFLWRNSSSVQREWNL